MKLVIVTYRSPLNIVKTGDEVTVEKSPGGLVAALDPAMEKNGGVWVCAGEKLLTDYGVKLPYAIKQVKLTKNEIKHYYEGFCNTQIWPLFHSFILRYKQETKYWTYYKQVNQKYANKILEIIKPNDRIWIHDYQLMLLPKLLREKGVKNKIGFFLHTPFPNIEIYRTFPQRTELIESLLNCNLIGFHAQSYKKHFIECADYFMKNKISIYEDRIEYGDIEIKVVAMPISIDYKNSVKIARSKEVKDKLKNLREIFKNQIVGLGADRLDYTKGIIEKFEGFELFLQNNPECFNKISLIQIAVPTRTNVAEYVKLKRRVDETVGRINGKYSHDGWTPIHYFYSNLSQTDLIAYYMLADFIIVSPLRDGLNLVAKEYAAAKIDNSGALILSEFTGAAEEMPYKYLINPYDINSIANAIGTMLDLDEQKRASEMNSLRDYVKKNDIFKWLKDFLKELD